MIRPLTPHLVNQIAAGEVIERPASVVKELVENAIDAGARHVEVTIEQGGCELVRVTDDGAGIPFDELPLALAAHATSKISSVDDLAEIASLGFRGEAIASIGSVSRLQIISRPAAQESAGIIEMEGDEVRPPRPHGAAPGTTVIVRNLFFNTPARRKFLRTEQTEAGRVRQVVEQHAMVNPSIGFTLRNGPRTVLELSPESSAHRRAIAVIGAELEPELLEVERREAGVGIWGLIGRPSIARSSATHVHLYVNGRPVRDRALIHAVREAYRGLIEPQRYPTVVLLLEMSPAQVDANVHPAKAEVRFRQPRAVHGAVMSVIKQALGDADLTPALDVGRAGAAPMFGTGMASGPPVARAVVETFHRLDPEQKGIVYTEVKRALEEDGAAPALPTVRAAAEVLQVQSCYLVTQDEDGLVIIDQHALHERVMFERLKARITGGRLESQRLLVPATFDVAPARMEHLASLAPVLDKLGIEAEPMGPRSVAVHSFTSLLFDRGVDPIEFMTDLLDRAAGDGLDDDPEAAIHEVLDMMACKAAVKAGDRLTERELAELLEARARVERSGSCPHGRPTTLRLSMAELDRQFGRR